MAKRTKKPKPAREIPLEDVAYKPYERAPHLAEIVGQDRALSILDRAMRSGKIHHAWIFQGPEGVGKFSTALALARVLLDPSAAPDLAGRITPDPESQTQRLIEAGAHPDLHVIRRTLAVYSKDSRTRSLKQTNIPLGVIREFLLEPASKTRVLSGQSLAHKVLIVDEAHFLAREGQNAMLKTLEEPPEGTVMILATSRESQLLTTVRSRCQRVGFSPLDEDSMSRVLSAQGVEASPWLREMADGSPGGLLRMNELGIDQWQTTLEPMLHELGAGRFPPAFGALTSGLVDSVAKAMVEGDPRASKESANREALSLLLRIVGRTARRAMIEDPERAEPWAAGAEAIRSAEVLISQNVQMGFVLDRLALGLHDALSGGKYLQSV